MSPPNNRRSNRRSDKRPKQPPQQPSPPNPWDALSNPWTAYWPSGGWPAPPPWYGQPPPVPWPWGCAPPAAAGYAPQALSAAGYVYPPWLLPPPMVQPQPWTPPPLPQPNAPTGPPPGFSGDSVPDAHVATPTTGFMSSDQATSLPHLFQTMPSQDPVKPGWIMDTWATDHVHASSGAVGRKTRTIMDWNVNNTYKKNLKDMEPKSVMDVALIPNIDSIDGAPGTSDKGIPTSKPRKKTMTSVYLKFFETAHDGKSRRCKFCGQSYSIATATGNLGRHLSNRHPGYDKSDDAVLTSSPQPITVVKKAQTQVKTSHLDLDHLNWLLIKWLILAALPPSTSDEKWLSNSFKFLSPAVKIWPGDRFQAVLHEVFRSMREDIKSKLEHVSSKFSITLDFWTSYQQIFYMGVTCQWIDETWSFHKVLLDICHVPSPCGSSEIYLTLIKVLKLYNLENRVLSCTHDNSTNAVHACHTLKEDLDGQKDSSFCYVPCAARTLNSIIDDGLRSTKSVIAKIREFVLEINSSPEMIEEFKQLTAAYQEANWKFPLDVSTRWSGTYQMLDIVQKAGKSMEAVISKYEDIQERLLLNPKEKNAVNIMHAYLEPFYKTTNDICTNKLPTIGLVLFFMDHISETITTCRESSHSPEWLKNAAIDMAAKAQSYNDQVSNMFTYMTAILDPRIKVELIPESLNLENYLEEARSHFVRNYSTTHFASTTVSLGSGQDLEDGGSSVSFAEEIARKRRRASMGTATDELTQYLSEPPAPIPSDVLEWWKVNSSRYPRLSVMARDFLAVQASSVVPEDLFCSKGDEVEKRRQSLPHSSMQAVLCVRSWTEGGMKLKYKSTEIDYERLMELAGAAAAENHSLGGFDKKQK